MGDNVAKIFTDPVTSPDTYDWLSSGYESGLANEGLKGIPIGDYSLGADISNWFTGNYDQIKDLYQNYYTNYMLGYNEYLDNTRYQRAYKDLMSAGLNPYLLVTGGSASPGSGGSYGVDSSFSSNFKGDKGSSAMTTLLKIAGMIILAGKIFG